MASLRASPLSSTSSILEVAVNVSRLNPSEKFSSGKSIDTSIFTLPFPKLWLSKNIISCLSAT